MKKYFGWILFVLFMIGTTFAVWRTSNISTYDMIMKRYLFTSNGTTGGSSVMDINSGGTIIAYGPLVNGSGDAFLTNAGTGFLTGYTETDPIWNIQSGDYVKWTSVSTGTTGGNSDILLMSQGAISGFVFSSLNPYLLISNSGLYYNSNPLGFITGSSLAPYCLLSGNQTLTGTINISDLYDGLGNKYITGSTFSNVVKTTGVIRTGGTGKTITDVNVTSGSVVMGWTVISGTQLGYRGFSVTGGSLSVTSTTGENVVFNYVIFK